MFMFACDQSVGGTSDTLQIWVTAECPFVKELCCLIIGKHETDETQDVK